MGSADKRVKSTSRQDTKLESEGAEFLVLGHLLIAGVSCYKAYVNFPGYDLIATNPETGKMIRIQVKSRWATDYDGGFPIRNFSCDFVVHVALNRGYRLRKRPTEESSGIKAPEFFIMPVEVVRAAQNPNSTLGKVFLRKIENVEHYQDNWQLIKDHLGINF